MIDFTQFPSPCYIMEEELLRKNLSLIKSVADRAEWRLFLLLSRLLCGALFPIFREYIDHSTASSVYEARLALEEFGVRHILIHLHIQNRISRKSCVAVAILLSILCTVRTFLSDGGSKKRRYFLWYPCEP